ncbi:MAG: DNA polymerase III subunit gamma/tau [Gammaproteobacteria bacterium]|nr:DNA polymerase III subunit gamma/tau [Gammaproteobacteria bacterium]
MSYTVLARKWRPRDFSELAGQEHVRRALVNALDGDRMHHAFLFTGTRGVGKTTVARILAKCLNCEKGVSSTPCGSCANCKEIDEGRFVDLIEVDAASRTKVDDTRELLDNVQYRPTKGAFKVYLIDEVHMLSKHSFNALLKTLEEPPEHVKFLLATTDPQKLPVTVLSRCLQFNLKKLPVDLIIERLKQITGSEKVPAAEPALARLARAADGSMRDALSLLDQAIAFGDGKIADDEVLLMLGSIDRQDVARLLQTLIAGDAPGVMRLISEMDEHAPDYENTLIELASVVQRAALAKAVPDAIDDSQGDRELALQLAAAASAEELQLYYQIALIGRRDLYLAANPRGGFEMVLLRMLAFRPAGDGDTLGSVEEVPAATATKRSAAGGKTKKKAVKKEAVRQESKTAVTPSSKVSTAATKAPAKFNKDNPDWIAIVEQTGLKGAVRELAANCLLARTQGNVWHLTIDERHQHLLTDQLQKKLASAVQKLLDEDVVLRINAGEANEGTLAAQREQDSEARMDAARDEIEKDPNVNALKDMFGATIVEDSIRPADGSEPNA